MQRNPKDNECYYLCVARGKKFLFVSNVFFDIQDRKDDDLRIHTHPNCRYRDDRTVLDFVYELIKDGMLQSNYND